MNDIEIFRCPLCKADLKKTDKSIFCENGHCFDISAAGYVNLLPVQKRNSKIPGDSKEMVTSRRNFLSKGYYTPLMKSVCEAAKEYLPGNGKILDCGCGEGYYTENIALSVKEKNGSVFGTDISKIAIEKAAKSARDASFAVAGSYDLPIKDSAVDILTDIFSPLALSEFKRVIRRGGIFLYTVPAEKHLINMKTVLYQNPYENKFSQPEYGGFSYIDSIKISFDIFLETKEDIMSLFKMTPYLWRTPKEGIRKLEEEERLEDRAEFYVHLLKKTDT